MSIEIIYGIGVFIFGLVLGSFYNVVGYRLPNEMSLVYPDSHCPFCSHKLKFYELIPVLSYIFQLGKCTSCKKRIALSYPFFELLTGIMFLISYLVFGLNMKFIISITFISILIIISISDIKYFIIPNEVLLVGSILIVIELVIDSVMNDISLVNGVLFPLLNGLFSFFMLYITKLLGDYFFKKESLGGGDIKLMFVIGLVLGFDMSIVTIFIASFVALPISIISLVKNDDNVLPFGPYLSVGATIILLCNLNLDKVLQLLT